MSEDAVRECRAHAALYKSLGYQPLPSDDREGAKKKPLVKFAGLWESQAPDDLFERFATRNIQVMLGRHWGLCVIDFDGETAMPWAKANWPPLPRTWVVESGGGGEHWWFSFPGWAEPRRKCFLWKGEGKHEGIEFLCERSLAMAPPSVHPTTGKAYRWVQGRSPKEMHRPTALPNWLMRMPPVAEPKPAVLPRPPLPPLPPAGASHAMRRKFVSYHDVMAAIPDRSAVARMWGLRFAGGAPSNGWVSVHDFNRDDANPSAQFNLETGGFWRPGEPAISFLSLGVAMGHYSDWKEACDDLAARFGVEPKPLTLRKAFA